ncbi:MAG: hypothetical protein WA883_06705, partial [Phormidesmis sp.]
MSIIATAHSKVQAQEQNQNQKQNQAIELAQNAPPNPTELPAIPTVPAPSEPLPTDTAPNANTAIVSSQAEAEDRLTDLISLMLGLLVLILAAGVIMLWFLRRSVVSEVATIVRTQLNEMTELENKVYSATRSLNRVLSEADDLSGELQGRSSNFQREIAAQREVLYGLIEELGEFKAQTARNWEQELEEINGKLAATATDFDQVAVQLRDQAKQRLDGLQTEAEVEGQRILQRFTTSEAEFSRHVGVIREETQRRKTAFFDEIERKESVLSDQMGSLQAETVAQKDRVLGAIAQQSQEFGPRLLEAEDAARTKIESQRNSALERLQDSEADVAKELAEIQASALGHRDLALQNIERATSALQQQFNGIRTEVEARKADMMQSLRQSADGFLTQFATLKADVEGRKGTLLGEMDRVAGDFKAQIADVQTGIGEERSHTIMQLQATAEGFRSQIANMGSDVSTRKTELYTELSESAREFAERLKAMGLELDERQGETLGRVRSLQGEFTREVEALQSGIGGEREQLLKSLGEVESSFSNELVEVRNTVFGRRDIILGKLNNFDARLGEQIGELAEAATERQQAAQGRLGQIEEKFGQALAAMQAQMDKKQEQAL